MITLFRKIIATAFFAVVAGPAFALFVPSGSTFVAPAGALNLACTALDVQGTFNLGTSQVNQGYIVGYDSAAVAEIQGLLARTVEAVQRAAVLPHCGTQAVLVPLAVCR